MTVAIKYLRRGKRIWGHYEWPEGGGHSVEVDIDTAANMLSYPRPDFELDPNSKTNAPERAKLAKLLGVDITEINAMFNGDVEKPAALADVKSLPAPRRQQLVDDFAIKTVKALAEANEKKIDELINKSGASKQEVMKWVNEARQLSPVEVKANGE